MQDSRECLTTNRTASREREVFSLTPSYGYREKQTIFRGILGFKGPIAVIDDTAEYQHYKTKGKRNQNKESIKKDPEKLKVYILSVTDALMRHVIFQLVPNEVVNASQGL